MGSALHYTLPNVHSSLIKLPTTNSFRSPHTESNSTITTGSGHYVTGHMGCPQSRDGHLRSHLSSTTRCDLYGSGYVSNISRGLSDVSRDMPPRNRLSRDIQLNGQVTGRSRDMQIGSASSGGMAEFEDTDSFESVSSAYCNARVVKF